MTKFELHCILRRFNPSVISRKALLKYGEKRGIDVKSLERSINHDSGADYGYAEMFGFYTIKDLKKYINRDYVSALADSTRYN